MGSRTKEMVEATAVFSVEAVGQVYNQTNECVYLGGMSTTRPTCPSGSTGAYGTIGYLTEVHPRTVRPTERHPRARNPDAKSRGSRGNTVCLRHVASSRACNYDTLRRSHHGFLTCCIGRQKNNRTDHAI